MRLRKDVAKLLARERVCRVATAGRDGVPHVVPVCHVLIALGAITASCSIALWTTRPTPRRRAAAAARAGRDHGCGAVRVGALGQTPYPSHAVGIKRAYEPASARTVTAS